MEFGVLVIAVDHGRNKGWGQEEKDIIHDMVDWKESTRNFW